MEIRFFIDDDSGEAHVRRHGMQEHEVEEVLAEPLEEGDGESGVRIAVGRTQAGRVLRIVYVPAGDSESVFVLTAYPLRAKPLKALRRRLRRR